MCTAGAVLFAAAAAELGAAQERGPLPAELAWVALFSEELLVWLENENRLDELCAGEPYPVRWHGCRAEQLEPKVALLPLRSEPRLEAARQGELVVVALPGRGLRAFVSRTGIAQRFTPDLYDEDWGYGPYFHQTILARQGSWFRIPLPVVEAAWINVEEWGESGLGAVPPIESLVSGQILTTPAGDMVALDVAEGVLRARREQAADLWCGAGDPPPLLPWQEVRLPFEQLFDARGHLLVAYKYTRGC